MTEKLTELEQVTIIGGDSTDLAAGGLMAAAFAFGLVAGPEWMLAGCAYLLFMGL